MTCPNIDAFSETRQIPLTKGYYATVDVEDYEWLNQWKWHALDTGHCVYAARTSWNGGRKNRKYILMHRQIMCAIPETHVDHRNGDGTLNCRFNLRLATRSQNLGNCKPHKDKKHSKHKGVTWCKSSKKWIARINIENNHVWLGRFDFEEDAAREYAFAAKKYFGEFARVV